MNISTIWQTACGHPTFIARVREAIRFSDIEWEDWQLLDVWYLGEILQVDVYAEFESDTYLVYPTFFAVTLTDMQPLKIAKSEILNG